MGKGALKEELVETDVLYAGGGIAGLMVAIRARELGAKVIVAVIKGDVRAGGKSQ
jgi:succinate dehydrogenase/fumarate reductase flavoprotein subunit